MHDTGSLDPTDPSFPELFLRNLARDGTFSHNVKCMGFALMLYTVGLFIALVTGVLPQYINNYSFLATTVAGGLTLCLMIWASKEIDPVIMQVSSTAKVSESEKFMRFREETKSNQSAVKWYYLLSIGFSLLFAILALLGFIGPSWIYSSSLSIQCRNINLGYYMSWCAIMGYGTGVALNLLRYYSSLVDSYSKRFLTPENVNLLGTVSEKSGLRPLGKLALKFSFACTMPTMAVFVTAISHYLDTGTLLLSKMPYGALVMVYTGILVFVFLFPLRHSHYVLARAKKNALKSLDDMVESIASSGVQNDLEALLKIHGIRSIRERITGTPSWPLNLGIFVRLLVTVLTPMIGGALLQIYLEYFLGR
jgi:hypothetical protein